MKQLSRWKSRNLMFFWPCTMNWALWTSYVILKRVPAHGRKSISRNMFIFGPMLIGTFLLILGWGIPRKSLWHRFWNTLYINYQFLCTDYYLFIKYYSPLHVSSLKCSSSGWYSCIHAAYGTVTLYESSWWPVGTQLERVCVYRQATTNFRREWQYHMLNVYSCILMKMST